jgi:hypothetical protein
MVAVMVMVMASAAFAQAKPKIAIYVTSGSDKSIAAKMLSGLGAHKTVGDALTKALNETGKCEGVSLTGDITKAHGAMVEDAQATTIGPQFEVQYLCIVLIRDVNIKSKTFTIGIGLVDVSRGQRIASGNAAIDLSDGVGLLKAMAKMALELTAGIVANVVLGPSGGGAGAGPAGPPVQQAASGRPARTVAAVYMSGEEPKGAAGAHMVIGEELAKAMSKGGNKVVNRTDDIHKLSAEERGDTLTKTIGERFGVPYVCVVEIKEVSGNSYYLNARMVNAETDETINTATAASNLSNSGEMAEVAQVIARELTGDGAAWAEIAPQAQETSPAPEPAADASQAKAEPVKPKPEPKRKEPKPERKKKVSAGGGWLSTNGFGGGIEWPGEGRVTMPYFGNGLCLFFDAKYVEATFGWHGGGAKWESANASNSSMLPDMRRSGVNFGLFFKYPTVEYQAGKWIAKPYPLVGIDNELAAGGRELWFDYGDIGGVYPGLSALWFKFGGGVDVGISKNTYLRSELLYGWRTANGFEKDKAASNRAKTALGSGLDFKLGIGCKI